MLKSSITKKPIKELSPSLFAIHRDDRLRLFSPSSVRREMVINYRIGYGYRNYIERTIYDKLKEDVYVHFLNFETRFRQPWGEINTNLSGKSFLQDPDKYSIRLDSWFSIRVFEGLSVRLGGELEFIRDQLSLPMRNASIEDLLLQQKEIATDFYSEFRIGLSYTFGSAFLSCN